MGWSQGKIGIKVLHSVAKKSISLFGSVQSNIKVTLRVLYVASDIVHSGRVITLYIFMLKEEENPLKD